MSNVNSIIGEYEEFMSAVTGKIEALGIDISAFEIDHICFRCGTLPDYIRVRDLLNALDSVDLLVESMIGGRPIATFSFQNGLTFGNRVVRCLELTSPKAGVVHRTGLEHMEVVIGSCESEMLNSRPMLEDFVRSHPTISFDFKAIDKEINADVSLELGDGTAVKFHARPLYEVIAYEISHGAVEPVPATYFD